jgi:hypothetical protein
MENINTDTFFTKANFLNWLDKQPEDRIWNFFDCYNCVFASFIKETLNVPFVSCGGNKYRLTDFEDAYNERYYYPDWAEKLSDKIAVHDSISKTNIKDTMYRLNI